MSKIWKTIKKMPKKTEIIQFWSFCIHFNPFFGLKSCENMGCLTWTKSFVWGLKNVKNMKNL